MTRLLVLPGDGVGPTVTDAATRTLEAVAPDVETIHGSAGETARRAHDQPVAPSALASIEAGDVDGVLFGAAATEPGQASAVLTLREATQAHLSVRPARQPGRAQDPTSVTVYRELSEGLYSGQTRTEPGRAEVTRTITREATSAFADAVLDRIETSQRTVIAHKANVLSDTDGLFLDTVQEVARRHGLDVDSRIVDALAHDLALGLDEPTAILAPNLYGDLLSDLTAGLTGGLGLAPSLTIGGGPPIAEPVHGTAPDVDPSHANPTGALASLALLLDELDRPRAADRLRQALHRVLADGDTLTPDQGGQATTETFTDTVLAQLEVPA